LNELEEKIQKTFGEVAVNKGLALRHEVARLPRFISEYLISKYCAAYPDRETAFSKLAEVVAENFPEPQRQRSSALQTKTPRHSSPNGRVQNKH